MTYMWEVQRNRGSNRNVLPKVAYVKSFEDAESLIGDECVTRNITIQYDGDPVPNCSRYLASNGSEYLVTRIRIGEWF